MPCNILIIDDNKHILSSLKMFLKNEFSTIETSRNPNEIPNLITMNNFGVVMLDMNFAAGINTGNEGIYWLKRIKELRPDTCVILITAYGDIDLAVKGMKSGAMDFVLKPWNTDQLLKKLRHACEISGKRRSRLKEKIDSVHAGVDEDPLIAHSASMNAILQTVHKVSNTDANILILGENGTGKQLIAREIHKRSARYNKPFISVDLGSLSPTLFESEIFGHIAGAYTDARQDRPGRFELAEKGTIFLDEIGNLALPLQSKLLSVIQSGKVSRVGSSKSISLDVRVVTATNMDLPEMVKNQQFREDLLYRINTIQIEVPPLRERISDITHLAEYYLEKYKSRYQKGNIGGFYHEAMVTLKQYHWPGNVRELLHVVEKAVILCDTTEITNDDLNLDVPDKKPMTDFNNLNLSELEKAAISRALGKNNRNLTRAAKELGITRATLYAKIEKYGL